MDFSKRLSEFRIELSDKQSNQFEEYFTLLAEWNEKMNLTAITEREDVYLKHFLDSLSFVKAFPELSESPEECEFSLIDIGTGAGFPGIPLKILFPNSKITLMDSLNKRITFLNEVVRKLDLNETGSIECIHARAEELAQNTEYREKYDYAVSRAVANLSTLSEYCLPFVKVGGYFVSYKSEKAMEEIDAAGNAIFLCGGKFEKEVSFVLPGSDLKRTLILIGKKQNTAKKYPRKAGLPTKNPL